MSPLPSWLGPGTKGSAASPILAGNRPAGAANLGAVPAPNLPAAALVELSATRRGTPDRSGGGHFFHGAYLKLPAGDYQALIRVRRINEATSPRVVVEAVRHEGDSAAAIAVEEFAITTADAATFDVPLGFALGQEDELEFRAWSDSASQELELVNLVVFDARARTQRPGTALAAAPREAAELAIGPAEEGSSVRIAAVFGIRASGEAVLLRGLELGATFRDAAPVAGLAGDLPVIPARSETTAAGWISAVVLLEGGARHGRARLRLGELVREVTLDRSQPQYVAVRLEPSDGGEAEANAPLEILVPSLRSAASEACELVITEYFDHYPRYHRAVSDLRVGPGSRTKRGERGALIVEEGTLQVPGGGRSALIVEAHRWSGLAFLRRGHRVNAIDLYSEASQRGVILGQSCDLVLERSENFDQLPAILQAFEHTFS